MIQSIFYKGLFLRKFCQVYDVKEKQIYKR